MTNNFPPNLQTEKLNSILKKTVILFGVGLIGGACLLLSIYIKKKANSQAVMVNGEAQQVSLEEFSAQCKQNIEISYQNNYIAIHSKSCNQIKIVPLKSSTISTIKY